MTKRGGWLRAFPDKGRCLLVLWLLGGVACSNNWNGPLVRLRLLPVAPEATQATLTATASDPSGQIKDMSQVFPNGPFDLLEVAYPPGTRGATSYQVSLLSDAECQIAAGSADFNIEGDVVTELPVAMSPVALCGNGATLMVQVANLSGGTGRVTSNPPGIDCQGEGVGCSFTFTKGTQVSLTAVAASGSFAGWSRPGCSGTGSCSFTATQDEQIQATFTVCRGWCVEPLPGGITANLNGISGTSASNILIVGDNGTAMHWGGSKWEPPSMPLPSGNRTLRAAAGELTYDTINVAGDNGTILRLRKGVWALNTTAGTAPLRAIAIGRDISKVNGNNATIFVGDDANAYSVPNGGGTVSSKAINAGVPLNTICFDGFDSHFFYIGGALKMTRGFATAWNGDTMFIQQMATGNSIAGNINAMLCRNDFVYATGDGGAIVRRSTGAGQAQSWMIVSSPTAKTLRGLWADSDSYMVAVGDGGTIVGGNGATWNTIPSPTTNNLRAVWGSSAFNIYAVGDGGIVLHYLP